MKFPKIRLRSFVVVSLLLTLAVFLPRLSPYVVPQSYFGLASNQSRTEGWKGPILKTVRNPDPYRDYDKLNIPEDTRNETKEGHGAHFGGQGSDQVEEGNETRIKEHNNSSSRSAGSNEQTQSKQKEEAERPEATEHSFVREDIKDFLQHDSYAQDYPDYTPPEFVEVLKKKVSTKKPARISSRERDKKYPAENKFSPETLRKRALMFPQSSPLRKFLAEQERRVGHITSTCPNMAITDIPPDSRGPPRGLVNVHNLIFDRMNLLTFCPVYKAASTSWTGTLLEISGYKRSKKVPLQKMVHQVYPKISNLAGPTVTRRTTKFLIVRHPFERLLSCYRDKFEYGKKSYYYKRYGEKMVRTYRKFPGYISDGEVGLLEEQVRNKVMAGVPVVLQGNPFANPVGPTFSEFVQFVIHAKHDDEHWRTYYEHCSPCIMDYDFILRFETLYEEGQQFLEYLNRTSQVKPRWDNPTHGGATTIDIVCSYYSQLPLDMIQKLAAKYERDFVLFEYKPDLYFKCAKDKKERN